MCVRIEDAGFEIRDMIAWVYGSGFPKSHNVSCAIDKANGHPNRGRAIPTASTFQASDIEQKHKLTSNPVEAYEAKTDAARQWQGWGTALKPALEPITVARKPLIGTVADNVMRYGTGALNVDGCRVGTEERENPACAAKGHTNALKWGSNGKAAKQCKGRWPANLIHDGSDEVTGLFPGDEGRFFYCPKASKRDRDQGLSLPESTPGQKTGRAEGSDGISPYAGSRSPTRNNHPTVKPTELMRYLCRLVTQPNGVVLDPFMGSGSTGKAAALEGFRFVGIEREPAYLEIAKARIESVQAEAETKNPDDGQMDLF